MPSAGPSVPPPFSRSGEAIGRAVAVHLLFVVAKAACVLAASATVALYLWVALSRIGFPFDLEWMEGSMVDHVRYLLAHGHVYAEPSIEFTPFIYNPLYYYVSAVATAFVGVDYAALRLVSLLASLVTFGFVFAIAKRETGSSACGAIATGLFAGTFALSGGWFDTARVDSLCTALAIAAIYCVRFARSPRALAGAGVLSFLAFATKQSALVIVPALALYVFWFQGIRRALWYAAPAIALSLALVIGFDAWSNGWYRYYAFVVPGNHKSQFTLDYWRTEIFASLAIAIAFGLHYLFNPTSTRQTRAFWLLVAAVLLASAATARAHSGSYLNVNIPAHLAIAILGTLGAARYLGAATLELRSRAIVACVALFLQFVFLSYNPLQWVPNARDELAADQLFEQIRAFKGEVLVAQHGHVGWREGKRSHSHDMAVYDLERMAGNNPAGLRLLRDFQKAIRDQRFEAIVLDWEGSPHLGDIQRYYRQIPAEFARRPNTLYTRVGLRVRPQLLYVRR